MSRFIDACCEGQEDGVFLMATPQERQALMTMLSMQDLPHARYGAAWTATKDDLAVLKEGLDALRIAALQPWGTGSCRDSRGVDTAELNRKTMRAYCAAMVLYLSGALDTMTLPYRGEKDD